MTDALQWKPDWAQARQALTAWWEHRGLALAVTAPKDEPWEDLPQPAVDPVAAWTDANAWTRRAIYDLSRTYFGGAAFPALWTLIGGPGSLGLFLGAIGRPAPDTLWYEPVIHDPDTHPALQLDREGVWWKRHFDVLEQATRENPPVSGGFAGLDREHRSARPTPRRADVADGFARTSRLGEGPGRPDQPVFLRDLRRHVAVRARSVGRDDLRGVWIVGAGQGLRRCNAIFPA